MDLMIDLETLSTDSNAAIVSIGMVLFDSNNIETEYEKFYRAVKLDSAVQHGAVDGDTLRFWFKQSKEAQSVMTDKEAVSLKTALDEAHTWIDKELSSRGKTMRDLRTYGNGADFDLPIIRHAIQSCNHPLSFHYTNSRCFRTLRDEYPAESLKPEALGVHHHALDDAFYQAKWLVNMRAYRSALDAK